MDSDSVESFDRTDKSPSCKVWCGLEVLVIVNSPTSKRASKNMAFSFELYYVAVSVASTVGREGERRIAASAYVPQPTSSAPRNDKWGPILPLTCTCMI